MTKSLSIFLLYLLSCITSVAATDTVSITVNHPQPRVGEEVTVMFDMSFFVDAFSEQLPDGVELFDSSYMGINMQTSVFYRKIVFNTPGKHMIGPFRFNTNGHTVVTDSVEITVVEKLPVQEGVWLRQARSDGKDYLILEQQVDENVQDYVEMALRYKDQVFLKERYSMYHSADSGSNLKYCFRLYEIEFGEDFGGSYTPTGADFVNLPRNMAVTRLTITR